MCRVVHFGEMNNSTLTVTLESFGICVKKAPPPPPPLPISKKKILTRSKASRTPGVSVPSTEPILLLLLDPLPAAMPLLANIAFWLLPAPPGVLLGAYNPLLVADNPLGAVAERKFPLLLGLPVDCRTFPMGVLRWLIPVWM